MTATSGHPCIPLAALLALPIGRSSAPRCRLMFGTRQPSPVRSTGGEYPLPDIVRVLVKEVRHATGGFSSMAAGGGPAGRRAGGVHGDDEQRACGDEPDGAGPFWGASAGDAGQRQPPAGSSDHPSARLRRPGDDASAGNGSHDCACCACCACHHGPSHHGPSHPARNVSGARPGVHATQRFRDVLRARRVLPDERPRGARGGGRRQGDRVRGQRRVALGASAVIAGPASAKTRTT